MTDRLDSIAGARLYPFGEERTPAIPNERAKFATYFRDNATGLDYAANRYFSSRHGRFTSPDPFRGSGNPMNPGSWNRYAYGNNDPINRVDPFGLDDYAPDGCTSDSNGNLICNVTVSDTADDVATFCELYPSTAGCQTDDGGGGNGFGGQGGSGGSSGGIAHSPGSALGPAGYTKSLALLKNASSDCLKVIKASSSAAAVAKLVNTNITYDYGYIPLYNAKGEFTKNTNPATTTSSGGISINLNYG